MGKLGMLWMLGKAEGDENGEVESNGGEKYVIMMIMRINDNEN